MLHKFSCVNRPDTSELPKVLTLMGRPLAALRMGFAASFFLQFLLFYPSFFHLVLFVFHLSLFSLYVFLFLAHQFIFSRHIMKDANKFLDVSCWILLEIIF